MPFWIGEEIMGVSFTTTKATKNTKMEFDELSQNVIGCAIESSQPRTATRIDLPPVPGLELSHARIPFQMELPLPVRYKDLLLDCGYRIDLLVRRSHRRNQKRRNASSNPSSTNSYLHATLQSVAWLLMNFNVTKLQNGIKRFIL